MTYRALYQAARRILLSATLVVALANITVVNGQVSSDGLLIQYQYETSNGVPVSDGASAAGTIDDTGLPPTINAIGSGGADSPIGLFYDENVPEGIGSQFSLNFPSPELADNYVEIPLEFEDEFSSITLGDFRVETWFRTTDAGRSNLVSSYTGEVNALNLELHTDNRGRIYVHGTEGITDLNVTLPTDSRDGMWHHLAGVRTEDIVELYYDGELVGSTGDIAGSYIIDKSAFYLGMDGRPSGTPRFEGNLDNVRVFSSADTSAPVAEYLFETIEGTPVTAGLIANDQVDDTANVGFFHGQASAAEALSSPTYVADAPSVLERSQYSFRVDEQSSSVEDGHIEVTPELAALTEGDFAVETWFKTTDAERSILLGGWISGPDTVNLELHTDNRVRIYIDGPNITDLNVTAPYDTRDDEWHHLLGQREGDEVSIFLDGELLDVTFDEAGPFPMQVTDMYLGRDSRTGATRFDGLLDETRIWSRALTESEIAALAAGEVPLIDSGLPGDFDGDGALTATDIDTLTGAIRNGDQDSQYDLNSDGSINDADVGYFVAELKKTWFGDSNLDGFFDTTDLVETFQTGEYEDDIVGNSGWADGDWNGNGDFGSEDFVVAFGDGGFEQGARTATAAVPEPNGHLLAIVAMMIVFAIRRRR